MARLWTIEMRRWDYSTFKQIVTYKKIADGTTLQICASETHENCKHDKDEIVLRKGTRIEQFCFYPVLRKIVLYMKTPQGKE